MLKKNSNKEAHSRSLVRTADCRSLLNASSEAFCRSVHDAWWRGHVALFYVLSSCTEQSAHTFWTLNLLLLVQCARNEPMRSNAHENNNISAHEMVHCWLLVQYNSTVAIFDSSYMLHVTYFNYEWNYAAKRALDRRPGEYPKRGNVYHEPVSKLTFEF